MGGATKIATAVASFFAIMTAISYALVSPRVPSAREAETTKVEFSKSSTAGCWSIADATERLKCTDLWSDQAPSTPRAPAPEMAQPPASTETQLSQPRDPSPLQKSAGAAMPTASGTKTIDTAEDIAFIVVTADFANKLCGEREAPIIAARKRNGIKLSKAVVDRTVVETEWSIKKIGVPAFCEAFRKGMNGEPATTTTPASSSGTFNMTPSELTNGYSARLRQDKDDGIKNCVPDKGFISCSFEDEAFRGSVKQLKAMNLVDGNIMSQQLLLIGLMEGKVSYVSIAGNRGDPANSLGFAGKVGSMLHFLGPRLTDKEIDKLLGKLKIMRGDSDTTIVNPTTEITDSFAVRCVARDSKVSTLVGCRFDPRF